MRLADQLRHKDHQPVRCSDTDRRFKHGFTRTQEYRAWIAMKGRCTRPSDPAWKNYGARGITVCDRWLHSIEAFVEDMGPKPSPTHEIDRIDNAKGYEPGNCRWVLSSVNNRNRRSARWVDYQGERRLLIELCEAAGLSTAMVSYRLDKRGWTIDQALTVPKFGKRS